MKYGSWQKGLLWTFILYILALWPILGTLRCSFHRFYLLVGRFWALLFCGGLFTIWHFLQNFVSKAFSLQTSAHVLSEASKVISDGWHSTVLNDFCQISNERSMSVTTLYRKFIFVDYLFCRFHTNFCEANICFQSGSIRCKLSVRWQPLSPMKAGLFLPLETFFLSDENATDFLWDQCCHLQADGAPLSHKLTLLIQLRIM